MLEGARVCANVSVQTEHAVRSSVDTHTYPTELCVFISNHINEELDSHRH